MERKRHSLSHRGVTGDNEEEEHGKHRGTHVFKGG